MILDADGRELRRAIGFRLEYRRIEEKQHDPVELIGAEKIAIEEHDALETCERVTDTALRNRSCFKRPLGSGGL